MTEQEKKEFEDKLNGLISNYQQGKISTILTSEQQKKLSQIILQAQGPIAILENPDIAETARIYASILEDIMKLKENNYVFIDSQNLNLAIRSQGWILDFKRFRVYLKDKYNIAKAFIFIGYVETNQNLYIALQEEGYILVFKPTLYLPKGFVKGNVDAELVLHTMIEYSNYDKAVIVSGDGDFYCLVEYLNKKEKLRN